MSHVIFTGYFVYEPWCECHQDSSHLNLKNNIRQYPVFTLKNKVSHCHKTIWWLKGAFVSFTQQVDTVD